MALRGGSAIALIAGLLVIASSAAAEQKKATAQALPPSPAAIEIKAQPIPSFDHRDPSRRTFGMLEYRGGVVLTSPFREFGGISAIRMAPDGEGFIALNDRAWWLRGSITYDGRRPTGIKDAWMAPILGSDGRAITARRWYDTEAIGQDGGTLYVALERVHRILRFDYGKSGLLARGRLVDVPPAMRKLPANRGVEALVHMPKGTPLGGTLIAISEAGLNGGTDHVAFLIGGPRAGTLTIKRRDSFSITDAALLPGGDMVILERYFGWTSGLFIRIRRLAAADIWPGATLDGTVLFEADLGQQIDNMEALGVHVSNGQTVLTMVSDDNFSVLQRTMLLQFTLTER
jgi:hypothetical protein